MAGLRLNLKPSKCHLFQKEILYLGHRITRDGVATGPGKIDAVRKWAVPRTVQEVQRFLGLVGYYRKFVSNHCKTVVPPYGKGTRVQLDYRVRSSVFEVEVTSSVGTYSGISRFYQNVHS